MKILVTGATGYIGGRLIPILLQAGHQVSVIVRNPERISGNSWANQLHSIIIGDCTNAQGSWMHKISDFDVAYYLIHSLYIGNTFAQTDIQCATNFAKAAQGIKHVIYLGGLLPNTQGKISEHLKSRSETGVILRSQLPTTELRAGPIIGSGSASFEMVRYLVERLPIMISPLWVENDVQPIAVRDALAYLVAILSVSHQGIIDIGMPPISFKDMLLQYAEVRKLKRLIIKVPVLSPGLASRWIGLITPISNSLATPLIKGILHPIYADTKHATQLFPDIHPICYKKAVILALNKIKDEVVETRWSSALGQDKEYTLTDWKGMFQEQLTFDSNTTPDKIFNAFTQLGGDKGWLTCNWAWKLRGFFDKLIGGPGLSRGRRKGQFLKQGDVIDFWRVEKIISNQELTLRAEMKLPGHAWLQFVIVQKSPEKTQLIQTAFFQPYGLFGFLYWWAMYPIHKIIFPQMGKKIIHIAELIH